MLNQRSIENLKTCIPDALMICKEASEEIDFVVFGGHRGKKSQNQKYKDKLSKVKFPDSYHNPFPSHAFDFYPKPFKGWKDKESFKRVANVLKKVAKKHGIKITCGADWGWDGPHIQFEYKKYKRTYKNDIGSS